MKTATIYFSSTGNSLDIATTLNKYFESDNFYIPNITVDKIAEYQK